MSVEAVNDRAVNARSVNVESLIDEVTEALTGLRSESRRGASAADPSIIEAAAEIVRRALGSGTLESDSVAPGASWARLLAPDATVRSRAFAEALDRHWLERGTEVTVWAVELAEDASGADRLALGRRLGAFRTLGLSFLGSDDESLYFLSRHPLTGTRVQAITETVRGEAAARGITVRAVGSARHDWHGDDLRATADQAARAARILGKLPQTSGAADISELGVAVLLDAVAGDASQLALYSPAAELLCAEGHELSRQTVETYLDVGGSVREACELLHIHRTTLYYRLDNLPDTVRAALDDGIQRSALHVCLKLAGFWSASPRR